MRSWFGAPRSCIIWCSASGILTTAPFLTTFYPWWGKTITISSSMATNIFWITFTLRHTMILICHNSHGTKCGQSGVMDVLLMISVKMTLRSSHKRVLSKKLGRQSYRKAIESTNLRLVHLAITCMKSVSPIWTLLKVSLFTAKTSTMASLLSTSMRNRLKFNSRE